MRLLSLARNAARLFAAQEPREKRRMLNFVLSNSTWKDGELTATFHQPFDLIAEMTTLSGPSGGEGSSNPPSHLNWLTRQSAANRSRREIPCSAGICREFPPREDRRSEFVT